MIAIAVYQCAACGAKKDIIHDTEKVGYSDPQFPFSIRCGWRGCDEEMRRLEDLIGDVVVHRTPEIPISTRPEDWAETASLIIFNGRHN